MFRMVDEKDREILSVLRSYGDASTREISERTGIPASTVHQRKQQLEEARVIQRYTVEVDWEALGYDFIGSVLMTVALPQLRRQGLEQADLLAELQAVDGVTDAHIITGEYDILISVRAEDKNEFNTILQDDVQSLTGVQDTTTMIALD